MIVVCASRGVEALSLIKYKISRNSLIRISRLLTQRNDRDILVIFFVLQEEHLTVDGVCELG